MEGEDNYDNNNTSGDTVNSILLINSASKFIDYFLTLLSPKFVGTIYFAKCHNAPVEVGLYQRVACLRMSLLHDLNGVAIMYCRFPLALHFTDNCLLRRHFRPMQQIFAG